MPPKTRLTTSQQTRSTACTICARLAILVLSTGEMLEKAPFYAFFECNS
jgi:hypothetical protein